MQFSPLNFCGLIQNVSQTGDITQSVKNGLVREIEIIKYECCSCAEQYDAKEDALECCHDVQRTTDCPVCNSACRDHRDATDCCLWKDLDGPTRWAMADKVEAGSTWAEVLNINNN